MKRRILRIAALVALVAGVSFIAMGSQGCGTAVHKANVAAASIGNSVEAAASVNHDLIQAGIETPDEGAKVATLIVKVAKSNEVFRSDLQAAEKNGTQLSAATVLTDFQTVVDSVNALQTEGVLSIKSADAQAKFSAVMTAIQGQIAVIKAILGSQTSRNGNPLAPFAALISLGFILPLTAPQIEELIAIAEQAGSSLVVDLVKLRGQTDAQLQATTEAADEAAITQAEADGGK